ncbi:putative NBD/HSP70 family sugar kinase [Hydrogenispora ethanolica]|uniref:Putative NBD/HSP70 family sugar kinase n=1 Tax=Hydrogenispora ethanolica TaxID=1082276 RepID=A0A4R1QN39_HYDET|nr:ROK family protein [Hydrogenispora ethanolica]TCL53675.1 putative NBD/HSP70 family sugar kinase [Hydrogenispora ethanolica]
MKKLGAASNSRDLKILNRILVLNTIRKYGPIARYEVSEKVGLTPPTVTVIVNEFLKNEIVTEIGWGESSGGRRPVMLELNSRAGYIFAVRIQQGELVTAILDLTSNILESRHQKLNTANPEDVVLSIEASLESLLEDVGISRAKILYCGIASPGLVNPALGLVELSSNLAWHNVPFGNMLSECLKNIPVHIENLSNAAALGEKVYGSGKSCPNLIYLNLSVGIGAGIIINNEVFGGAKGYAGEVGKTETFINGQIRCFEDVCGSRAVLDRVKSNIPDEVFESCQLSKNRLTIGDLFLAPLVDIPEIKKIINETGMVIGMKVANLISIFNTGMVILGGELGRAGDLLLDIVKNTARENTMPEMFDSVQIISSTMQEDPPLMGVYALVLEKVFNMGLLTAESDI